MSKRIEMTKKQMLLIEPQLVKHGSLELGGQLLL
jgi:hypothetical protein